MMSKVIVTNTLGKPIFIFGKLITPGASIELDAGDVPDALKQSVTPVGEAAVEPVAEVTGDKGPAKTDEELLVAAAAKAKK